MEDDLKTLLGDAENRYEIYSVMLKKFIRILGEDEHDADAMEKKRIAEEIIATITKTDDHLAGLLTIVSFLCGVDEMLLGKLKEASKGVREMIVGEEGGGEWREL